MAELSGRRLLIVGGETEVGRALVVDLAEAGADLAIATRSESSETEFAVNSALNELWAMGRAGVALVIDASDEDEVREAARRAERELGHLDAAVVVQHERRQAKQHAVAALRAYMPDRPVVPLSERMARDEALRAVVGELPDH